MTTDTKAIEQAVRLIVGDGVTELRALDSVTASDRWPHTESGYFDDPTKLAAAVGEIQSAKGIYIVVNPVDPALLARASNRTRKAPKGESTQDTNILRRRWLLIDADAKRPSGISSTDEEHDAAIERYRSIYRHLKDSGYPDPIAGDSGNGGHLMYRIDLRTDDDGLVKRCLTALAEQFDDDVVTIDQGVFNPARFWKLYRTLTCKGDDTSDRPHRMARILMAPNPIETVSAELLENLAGEVVEAERPQSTKPACSNGQAFDVEGFITRNGLEVDSPDPWTGNQ